MNTQKKSMGRFSVFVIALILALGLLEAAAFAGAGFPEDDLQGMYSTCLRDQTQPLIATLLPDDIEYDHAIYGRFFRWSYRKPLVGRDKLVVHQGYKLWDKCTTWPEPEIMTTLGFRKGGLSITAFNNYSGCYGDVYTTQIVTLRDLKIPFYKYETETRVTESVDELGNVSRAKIELVKPGSVVLMEYKGPKKLPFLNGDTGRPILNHEDRTPMTFDVEAYKSCLTGQMKTALAARPQPVIAPGAQPKGSPAEVDATDMMKSVTSNDKLSASSKASAISAH